ncbi:hypothetical protein PV327_005350 [Microctonus hyperodae]|uniref:Uncharacterized protein n=1 Tax=Microctonus hyperodae TaxID=165561 RepID=A0AA39G161_MICHY|nr:hypothetical protein PV327_005350 [Microctonus hyperodae]
MYTCIFTHKHTLVPRTQDTRGHALFLLLANNYSRALSTSFVSFVVSFSHSSNVLSSPSCPSPHPPNFCFLALSFSFTYVPLAMLPALFFSPAHFLHTHISRSTLKNPGRSFFIYINIYERKKIFFFLLVSPLFLLYLITGNSVCVYACRYIFYYHVPVIVGELIFFFIGELLILSIKSLALTCRI